MVCSVLSMRSTAIAVTLVHPLFVLFFFGAMAKSSAPLSLKSSSDSSSKDSNGYDASICGQDGYSDGSGYSCESIRSLATIWIPITSIVYFYSTC